VHLLPARDECVEAFQWLAQEIRQAQGDAVVMHVCQIEGLTDQQLIASFHAARKEEYDELDAQAKAFEQAMSKEPDLGERDRLQEALGRLRRRYAEIARIDYFDCPEGIRVGAHLAALARTLSHHEPAAAAVPSALISDYRAARWITRPRPHVDRLACAWLIRRYINPTAVIRYAMQPEPGDVTFDMADAQFGHTGNLCSFETMLTAFGLDEPALRGIAEVVHEIDLQDGLYLRPETAGIDAVLRGWLLDDLSDLEPEARGMALFSGMYAAFAVSHPSDAGEWREERP
jgi:hypothetical protein